MTACVDRRYCDVFSFKNHSYLQRSVMASFQACPDCAKKGIVSAIVPRRVSEDKAIWKCSSADCIYPITQSLEVFEKLIVPYTAIDERLFRRYVHYDVRSETCNSHSETSSNQSPQYSPIPLDVSEPRVNYLKPISTDILSKPKTEFPNELSFQIPDSSVDSIIKTTTSFNNQPKSYENWTNAKNWPSRVDKVPCSSTDVIHPSTLQQFSNVESPKNVDLSKSNVIEKNKADRLFDRMYTTEKRPPSRAAVTKAIPSSFLKHLARKRPVQEVDDNLVPDIVEVNKKERILPEMDKFFVRSSKVAKSLLPELHTRHVSDATSFDGYKSSVQRAPLNSAFTPSCSPSFLSYSAGRDSPAGSQKSDDGSSSTNSRSKRSNFLSAAVKNAILSNINASKNVATAKTPMHHSPSSSSLSVLPVYQSVSSNSIFDAVQNNPNRGFDNYVRPPMPSANNLSDHGRVTSSAMTNMQPVPFNAADDYFDYVPNFDIASLSAPHNMADHEIFGVSEEPLFIDLDDAGNNSSIYAQL